MSDKQEPGALSGLFTFGTRHSALGTRHSALGTRTLVVGLGNPLLADDGVGLRVAAYLRPLLADREGVQLGEDYCGGLHLMERMIGFDRAIVIDAKCSAGQAGAVSVLSLEDLPTRHSQCNHDVDLRTALALGRRAGAALPPDNGIRLVAIEVADVSMFGEHCTPLVEDSIGPAAKAVLTLLESWK